MTSGTCTCCVCCGIARPNIDQSFLIAQHIAPCGGKNEMSIVIWVQRICHQRRVEIAGRFGPIATPTAH